MPAFDNYSMVELFNDLQALSRGKLLELEQMLKKQVKKKRNNTEHYHFVDLAESIRIALEREQN